MMEAPLDLSVASSGSSIKLEYCTDDSEDSDSHGGGPNCKAYKKSLMKRYCESELIVSK